jgi:hypothetical protein
MGRRDSHGRFIKATDKGIEALKARIAAATGGVRLTVGIHEADASAPAEGEDSDVTLGDVAAFNEFGGPDDNPPRRSFLADWADENVDEHKELMRRSARAVIKGQVPSVRVAFERLGLRFVGEIQQRIKGGIEPENRPSTVERKGSSTPLIAGGQLWTHVTHQVESGTGGSSGEGSE